MDRRIFMRAGGGLALLTGTPCRPCRADAVAVAEPLIDGKSRGKVTGGRFVPEGWQAVSEKDHILYELPEPWHAGTIEFSIRGVRLGLAGDPRKHIFGLFDRLQDQYSEDDNNSFVLQTIVTPSSACGTTRSSMDCPA